MNCKHDTQLYHQNIDTLVLEKAITLLSAMSDTSRLKLLLLLDQYDELCVSEIAEIIGDKVNTISMRLKKLYDAGLVSKRREAKHIFYRLKDEHIVKIIKNALEHTQH